MWVRGQGYGSSPAPLPPAQCDPNLQVYNVFIDNLDERLPRIALFATRHIRAGEELTFDYNMQGECLPGGAWPHCLGEPWGGILPLMPSLLPRSGPGGRREHTDGLQPGPGWRPGRLPQEAGADRV